MATKEYAEMEGIEEIADGDDALGESINAAEPEQLRIEGTYSGISSVAGTMDPVVSTARMKGQEITLEGEFRIGDRVTLKVECVVTDVNFRGKRDAEGRIASVTRVHALTPDGVARADSI